MNVHDPQTYALIGAAMEVHRHLGCGFLESVYHEALAAELAARQIDFRREAALPVIYKGAALPSSFRMDFICYDQIVVEIKALPRLSSLEEAQVLNYLKASGLSRALLLNFGAESLQHKRFVRSQR